MVKILIGSTSIEVLIQSRNQDNWYRDELFENGTVEIIDDVIIKDSNGTIRVKYPKSICILKYL